MKVLMMNKYIKILDTRVKEIISLLRATIFDSVFIQIKNMGISKMGSIVLLMKSNPFLYKKYIFLTGKFRPQNFPTEKTDLVVAGHERSGNTFVKKTLRVLYPHIEIANQTHSIASLKIAERYNLNVLVTIRDPKESIPSSIIRHIARGKSFESSKFYIREYVYYYEYILRNSDKYLLLDFNILKDDTPKLFAQISQYCDLKYEKKAVLEASGIVVQEIKSRKNNYGSEDIGKYGWNDERKDDLKKEILEKIENEKVFGDAIRVYNALQKIMTEIRKS